MTKSYTIRCRDNVSPVLKELAAEVECFKGVSDTDIRNKVIEFICGTDKILTVHQHPADAGECWIDLELSHRVVEITAALRTLNRNLGKVVHAESIPVTSG